jgi:hypothetical protein
VLTFATRMCLYNDNAWPRGGDSLMPAKKKAAKKSSKKKKK